MNPPTNQTLPFFAYGVFRPGELAFLQIKEFVESCRVGASIRGVLRIRDGLPIASPEDNGEIFGTVIKFRPGSEAPVYQRIADLEPDKQYRWEVASAGFEQANFLAGRSPRKGSDHPEEE